MASIKFDVPEELKAYVERIGGEVLNWRRAMVKEYNITEEGKSYYRERTLIKIDPDGTINLAMGSDPAHEPTDEEREAIIKAYAKIQIPTPVLQSFESAELLRQKLKVPREKWFVIRNFERDSVIFCQQRVDKEDGSKFYLPWTYYNLKGKAEWIQMEPGMSLPFWKPPKREGINPILIHEGSKAALYIDWMCFDESHEAQQARKKHPWYSYLKYYQHWGINGGALAPHRADYAEIRRANPSRLVYACDRDYPGEHALQQISKNLAERRLVGLMFDKRFKTNWDMADPLPDEFFRDGGIYIGPRLDEMERPATRATEFKIVPDIKKPQIVLRQKFKEDWYHCITPECYINMNWPARIYSGREEFNNVVFPFSDLRNVAMLLQADNANKMDSLCYMPDSVPGPRVIPTGGRAFNTHQPSGIRPKKNVTRKDMIPWIDYLDQLLPLESDRLEVMRWCATLIEKPSVKMSYAMLLCSEQQGVGKTTLGQNILGPLVGPWNLTTPSAQDIVDSQFNNWQGHCRLVLVNEIYEGHSVKAYNRLKSLITDKTVEINRKYIANYKLENWAHIIACSNNKSALKLPDEDRRWFVPEVTESLLDHKYWVEFNEWLVPEGLSVIKAWAHEFLKENDAVRPGARAPFSSAKAQMIKEGWSPGQTLVADFLSIQTQPLVVTDMALQALIREKYWNGKQSDRLERPMTIRKIAKALGWYVSRNRVRVENGLVHTISNKLEYVSNGATWGEIKETHPKLKMIKSYSDFPMA